MRLRRKIAVGVVAAVTIAGAGLIALDAADKAFPPPLDKARVSAEVLDADGELLRAFATPEGRWRLKTDVGDVDPQFLRMLVAYEDRRFYEHGGIDARAI
ncbi:transglycosylase domain-containing protein, partial [Rhizobium sp.]|uniref:transglycosylase domain-containing protein n=1 Tax=Rhizobium sp. TaxID=391 RepID=UPI0028AD9234